MTVVSQKLLFVSMTNTAGGAEQVLGMMANEANCKLIFLKRIFKECLPIPNNQEVVFLTKHFLFIGFLLLVKALYKYRSGFTIISTHPYLNAYLGVLKRIGYLKSDLVVRECSSIFIRYTGFKKASYKLAYKLGYPVVNLVVCQTDVMRNQLLINNSFISKNKVIVRKNPIDLNKIVQLANEKSPLEDFKTDFICAAGRLIPEKGFDLLINSFYNLSKENLSLRLFILGEGTERSRLQLIIDQFNLQDRIILKGHILNPIPYFENAKLCVVSSIQEGFPNVLLEMMAVNNTVVSTLCAGGIEDIPLIIKAEANNISALTVALRSAIELSKTNKTEKHKIEYLRDRNPSRYLNSILEEAGKLKYQLYL